MVIFYINTHRNTQKAANWDKNTGRNQRREPIATSRSYIVLFSAILPPEIRENNLMGFPCTWQQRWTELHTTKTASSGKHYQRSGNGAEPT